uniref:Uncharacterized protein n=1 Tax=Anguilla anguilla TaxID=7936 RepID=A0A0E9XQ41_ANGAN
MIGDISCSPSRTGGSNPFETFSQKSGIEFCS